MSFIASLLFRNTGLLRMTCATKPWLAATQHFLVEKICLLPRFRFGLTERAEGRRSSDPGQQTLTDRRSKCEKLLSTKVAFARKNFFQQPLFKAEIRLI
jgi:hypothetical protein